MNPGGASPQVANATMTAVKGVRVGHAADFRNFTGTTVVLLDRSSTTVVDVRGGWPGTVDTDSVGPGRTFHTKHAIFLTGGDVFGLKCAFGVQRFLLEKRLASAAEPSLLPGVVGANIYDIEFGRPVERVDYEGLGYAACENASKKPVQEGSVGAGCGASVGKLKGIGYAMKGGVGSSAARLGPGFSVGALVVANSVGNVFDQTGVTIAGTRKGKRGEGFVEMEEMAGDFLRGTPGSARQPRATTIGVVATDLGISHEGMMRVAEMAHDGIARCVRPAHGATDGDTLFCVSTGQARRPVEDPDLTTFVGHMAASVVQAAVLSAVRNSKSLAGIPSLS